MRFQRRVLWTIAAAGVGLMTPTRAVGQARATDAEQRAIEITVADHLRQRLVGDSAIALEPRLYPPHVASGYRGQIRIDGPELAASHGGGHLGELSRILSVGIISDSNGACLGRAPEGCRFGSYARLLSFAPGFVEGDTARIQVSRWTRTTTPRRMMSGAYLDLDGWIFTLARRGAGWMITTVSYFII
jgi:hypothetical protein